MTLPSGKTRRLRAPKLDYLPRDTRAYRPGIGVIGCGNITPHHLRAYRDAGYAVKALCDCVKSRAAAMRDEFFPDAAATADYREILIREDIGVVDLVLHPDVRLGVTAEALEAGKHVLSQKPFVTNLENGRRLIELADRAGVCLAVNQNGRWAPHFSYMQRAIAEGHIGRIVAAHFDVHWDHDWTADTVFNTIRHLILYDFGIHWFDMLQCFMGDKTARRVYASVAHAPDQRAAPPLLGQVLVEYEDAQATLVFDGMTRVGSEDHTVVVGTEGMLSGMGPDLDHQTVTITTPQGAARASLKGTWFTNGFHGTMGELLCAIEQGREPSNSARNNLASLALCFAAIASAETHLPQVPGEVTSLPVD